MIEYYRYSQSLEQLQTQFEFLRYALSGVSEKRANEFFSSKGKKEFDAFETKLNKFTDILDDQNVRNLRSREQKHLKQKWGTESRSLYRKQFVPDDLNKSELLLLVALFEGFLGDVYSALIYAEPRRVFAHSEKSVSLKEVFVDNVGEWRKSKFFEDIADEAVSRFDHLSFKDRMVALTKRFEFKFEDKEVKVAHELIERRHKISHCWTDRNEVKHVGPQDLEEARRVFNAIPRGLVRQASAKYPNHFKS